MAKLKARRFLPHPDLVAREYQLKLNLYLKRMHDIAMSALAPVLHELDIRQKMDAKPPSFEQALKQAQRELEKAYPTKSLNKLVAPSFDPISKMSKFRVTALTTLPSPKVEKWLPGKQAEYVQANVELIKSLPERYFEGISKLIIESADMRADVLQAKLEERYGVSESQAELIAVDQTNKLVAELDRERMSKLGITRATWQTSNDERVRESHAEVNGEEFDIEEGLQVDGEQAWPGSPVRCRCVSIPIID